MEVRDTAVVPIAMLILLRLNFQEDCPLFASRSNRVWSGVILPDEIRELKEYGITEIYSPDDGRKMGLQGMINDMLKQCDFLTRTSLNNELQGISKQDKKAIASAITLAENHPEQTEEFLHE
uniref:hypothetical protein n=1 Tax=Daejeonella sp. TaxID=2805397 RepID=UPI00404917D2